MRVQFLFFRVQVLGLVFNPDGCDFLLGELECWGGVRYCYFCLCWSEFLLEALFVEINTGVTIIQLSLQACEFVDAVLTSVYNFELRHPRFVCKINVQCKVVKRGRPLTPGMARHRTQGDDPKSTLNLHPSHTPLWIFRSYGTPMFLCTLLYKHGGLEQRSG